MPLLPFCLFSLLCFEGAGAERSGIPGGVLLGLLLCDVYNMLSAMYQNSKIVSSFHLWENTRHEESLRLTQTWGRRELKREENERELALDLECERALKVT